MNGAMTTTVRPHSKLGGLTPAEMGLGTPSTTEQNF
jgi:hypothetical protein